MRSTTRAISRKKRRATTAATWPSCVPRPPALAWCWGPPRPASKAGITPSAASTRCSHCPKCQSEHIYFMGVGSEKVEEELHREFPKARIARLDRDTATAKRQYEAILQGFREASYDILVDRASC